MTPPRVVLFDVNETLSDLSPLAGRFTDVGLPGHLLPTWFAAVLRDGFALAATGRSARFADVADAVLRTLFAEHPPTRAADDAVEHVLSGFPALPVHPDVVPGVRALQGAGLRLVTLSNGSASVADALLTAAGVRAAFERLLSVEQAGVWKPAAASYAYALEQCGVPAERVLLVAVHPWDVDGAARAGLRTAWVARTPGTPYPPHCTPPDLQVTGLDDLARRLRDGGSVRRQPGPVGD